MDRILTELRSWSASLSPQGLLLGGFAVAILLGGVLLWLPWAHLPGRVSFLSALFTSASAVCVTGLVVVDTGADYTVLGQVIILVLIQAGGLGIMTFAALAFHLLGRRLSLQSQAALHDSLFQEDMAARLRTLVSDILRMTVVIELAGVVLLYLALWPRVGAGRALYSAVFHSISAFCNAGFSVYTASLMLVRESPLLVGTVMVLIVLGGMGHPVLLELHRAARVTLHRETRPGPHLLSPHARTVLLTSGILVLVGGTGLLGLGLTPAEASAGPALSGALFQSVTARTAGFNTVDIGALPAASLLLLTVLMFVGGSPGSCAGGIKTTSLALWLARLRASLLGEAEVRLCGRRIPAEIVARSSVLVALALAWNLAGALLLLATETGAGEVGMADVLFEQVSAFGTVGLSTGLTPNLSTAGRLWIIATMFVGRVGPLTIAMRLFRSNHVGVRYPEGRIMIG